MSEPFQIICKCSKVRIGPRIRCCSIRLTLQTMSEPFQIFFKSEKVGIGYIHSLYMLNNAWMGLNFISIGKIPNRSLLNPTGIPDNVRTIPNNFWILKSRNRIILIHLYTIQCAEGPKYYFIVNYSESASIQSDWHPRWCPNHSKSDSDMFRTIYSLEQVIHLVFGSPVTRPEKDRDQTGPGPEKTGNFEDHKRP